MTKLPLVVGLGVLAVAGCGSSPKSSTSHSTSKSSASKSSSPTSSSRTSGSAPAAAKPITADLSEWAIKTSASTANAGKVTFDVSNAGKIKHEFVVLKTSKTASRLGTGARIKETGHVGEVGDLAAGKAKTLTLDLKPGHYSLVCNLPGHYMSGMHTDFTVK